MGVPIVWPFLFAILIVAVVVLKYLNIGGNRCPQCSAARDPEMPLCGECGWIFDSGEEDDEEDDLEDELEFGSSDVPEVDPNEGPGGGWR